MNTQQAGLVIAALQGYFPRFPIPERTQDLWVRELARQVGVPRREESGVTDLVDVYGYDVAAQAVEALGRTWTDDHFPGLQALLGKMREVRGATSSPALPYGDVSPQEAADARQRMHELVASFFDGREDDRIEAAIAVHTATPEERDARSRRRAQAMLDAGPLPEITLPRYAGGRVPSPCPIGARPEVRDGFLVCPNCGEPVYDADGRAVRAKASVVAAPDSTSPSLPENAATGSMGSLDEEAP